ncbi:MAG: hypothetical protein POELPBGB_03120 [Bacteroidia bacterium]|nr:hypothetical protein [Bacteroidia bacterium]
METKEGFDYFNWIVLPLIIYFARMTDVTLGTLRIVMISKGKRKIVPVIGFFEVLLWLIAIGQIMQNLTNVMCYFAWAAGYATGTFLGLTIEQALAIGTQVIRIITNKNSDTLLENLKKEKHGFTVIDGQGAMGPVKVIFIVAERKNLKQIIEFIDRDLSGSFYSVEDVRETNQGVFNETNTRKLDFARVLLPLRKGT